MRFHVMGFAVLTILLAASAAQSQSLDLVNVQLLSNNCAGLGHDASTNDPDFGPGLDLICQIPGSGTGGSGGGTNATSYSADATVANRRGERFDEGTDRPMDLFFSADFEGLNRDSTTFEDGYDSMVYRGTLGVDTLLSDTLLVGGFFAYTHNDGDFDAGGDFQTDSFSPTLFASFLPMQGMFADVSFSYSRHEYDRSRRASYTRQSVPTNGTSNVIVGDADSSTAGDQIGATLLVGYDQHFDGFQVGPRAGLNYSYQDIHSYGETGGTGLELNVRDQYVTSLQSTVGLQAAMAISTPLGVLSPTVSGDYVHEFENNQRHIRAHYADDLRGAVPFSFENSNPDRDFFYVGAGAVLALPNGFQPYVNFRALVGHSYYDNYAGTIGVRMEL